MRSSSWWIRYFVQTSLEENEAAIKKFDQAAAKKSYKPACQVFHLNSYHWLMKSHQVKVLHPSWEFLQQIQRIAKTRLMQSQFSEQDIHHIILFYVLNIVKYLLIEIWWEASSHFSPSKCSQNLVFLICSLQDLEVQIHSNLLLVPFFFPWNYHDIVHSVQMFFLRCNRVSRVRKGWCLAKGRMYQTQMSIKLVQWCQWQEVRIIKNTKSINFNFTIKMVVHVVSINEEKKFSLPESIRVLTVSGEPAWAFPSGDYLIWEKKNKIVSNSTSR